MMGGALFGYCTVWILYCVDTVLCVLFFLKSSSGARLSKGCGLKLVRGAVACWECESLCIS